MVSAIFSIKNPPLCMNIYLGFESVRMQVVCRKSSGGNAGTFASRDFLMSDFLVNIQSLSLCGRDWVWSSEGGGRTDTP